MRIMALFGSFDERACKKMKEEVERMKSELWEGRTLVFFIIQNPPN
jgi:hypothetical protein